MTQLKRLVNPELLATIVAEFSQAIGRPVQPSETLRALGFSTGAHGHWIRRLDQAGAYIPITTLETLSNTLADCAAASEAHDIKILTNPSPWLRLRTALGAGGLVPIPKIKLETTLAEIGNYNLGLAIKVSWAFEPEGIRLFEGETAGFTKVGDYWSLVRDLVNDKEA
ncbi:hypothetical protein [Actomonas aquatica]|uniref:Uncharacterized protein n=1 Tax=Actomonas aquatica TaxID=2866162 RepID=A0ABZ1C3L1_9BACT|nr:hypothetical protein [Opitutus sp. WL0086]WRQ85808.1 hypothetical protein K1X11_013430 [Opitutus sp. WL0086]